MGEQPGKGLRPDAQIYPTELRLHRTRLTSPMSAGEAHRVQEGGGAPLIERTPNRRIGRKQRGAR